MADMERKVEIPEVPAFADSAYFPEYTADEMPDNEQVKNLVKGRKASEEEKERGIKDVKGLNDIMPFPIKIVSAAYDEATNQCHASLYVSDRLRHRIEVWARENDFAFDAQTENFDEKDFKLSHMSSILRSREKVTITVPVNEESLKKIADTDKARFEATTPLSRAGGALANQVLPTQIEQVK